MMPLQRIAFFRSAQRLYDACCAPVCAACGLTRCELDVLAFLHNNPGFDTAQQVAEIRMLPKANVSQAVDGLMRKGLLTRRPDEADRRRLHLRLTPAAAGPAAQIAAAQQRFTALLLGGLDAGERAQLEILSEKLDRSAQQALERIRSDAAEQQ